MSQDKYGQPPPPAAYNQPGGQYPMQAVQQQPGYNQGGVTVIQSAPKPENHMIFSIFVCLCCNWICGLFGIYYAMQSDSAYNSGNLSEAQNNARQAKKCSMIGLICGIISVVVSVIFIIIYYTVIAGLLIGAASSTADNYPSYP